MKQSSPERIQKLREELDSMMMVSDSSFSSSSSSSLSSTSTYYTDLELDSFLQFQKTVPAAAKALLASQEWKDRHNVSIADVSHFYRAPPGRSVPAGCLFCLEDFQQAGGDVARDAQGRPIICMIGMVYGSEDELKQQIAYALQRAAQYRLPHHRPDEVCFVAEVVTRDTKSLNPTFRFPDAPVRSLFDFMKTYYPGSQFSVVHFCGLPSFVTAFFKMVKPFVSEEIFGRLKLKSNFSHLKKDGHIGVESLLPHWDKEGTFEFDLDRYVEWRAQQEGIPMDQICPRGQGRSYDGKFQLPTQTIVTTQELLQSEMGREKVIKAGWTEKQGSGMGLFASNRWKPKYLVLAPGLLLYFESAKISASNQASRLIPIDESSSVVLRFVSDDENNNNKALVCLQSANREYVFGFQNKDEADEWTQALQKQCLNAESSLTTATTTTTPMMINPLSVSTLFVGDYQICQQDTQRLIIKATLRQ